jgi:hypothetical protein
MEQETINTGLGKTVSSAFVSRFVAFVYGWMTLGLAVTAVVAFILSRYITENPDVAGTVAVLILPIFIVELILVWVISSRAHKMSIQVSAPLFILYSLLNGIFFSLVLAVNDLDVAGVAFLATAITFGVMSLYGTFTKQDLTKWGNIAFMGLIAGIIGTFINILFAQSEGFYWVITYGLLIVFVILVAYDTQKIKAMAVQAEMSNIPVHSYAISGALALYLDFINLFLLILRILGGGRD